jgi:hypothetical protein
MNNNKPTKTEQILDLLLDALLERQATRGADEVPPATGAPAAPAPVGEATAAAKAAAAPEPIVPPEPKPIVPPAPIPPAEIEPADNFVAPEKWTPRPAVPHFAPSQPEALPSIQLDQMLRRLALGLVLLIILVNIPFNSAGTTLARAMPDARSLIIRDGLVLKGSGERIYVLENNRKRWISSLDAFAWHGYRWEQVNIVEDVFLDRFEDGRPIYVLLKCAQSPHIYALEEGQKRWIRDIPAFEAEGFVWEDVKVISCAQLRQTPTGIPIPPDAGPSPEP